ncbi:hypothetical protein SD427_16940 [Chryseobacterium sp. JJR-5R]|uniref:hypothetical protein n=1 Tax=Chryseobacterium sp. JJR-5R TaxID=3093923 RepID=UPI002A748527|nr:hypothetical protein [Chryseobacterium sp. JJR-5R]WPO82429.1 hypothetical protein SD427_16940 [Chryseobacterium sp. JJR-5R]
MITQDHELQIETYLQSKKLYHELHLEIKDHFMSQISDEMANHDIGFQEAFLKTKSDWGKELEMVRADIFSFKKIARIEKQVLKKRFRKIIFSSAAWTLLFIAFFFMSAEISTVLQLVLMGSWISLLGYSFLTKKITFSHYVAICFHPLVIRNILLSVALVFLVGFIPVDFITALTDVEINRFFLVYATLVQLQILYFKVKRINVLV